MPEGTEQREAQGGTPAQTPPWEKNGQEFNAEKAWTLIQNLTGERDRLNTEKAALALDLTVERLAREHGITEADDLATLRAITDPGVREKAAARLAPRQGGEPDVRRTPRPDASQGPKDHSATQVVAKPGLSRLTAGITNALETMN